MKSHSLKQSITILKIILLSLTFTFLSCNKDDMNNNETDKNVNYYVKYIISGNGTYGRFSNWTATTPQGIYKNNGYQVNSWNQTYGPAKKGFKCEIRINDYIGGAPTIKIYVSKNNEPFILKLSKTGDSALYSIDF